MIKNDGQAIQVLHNIILMHLKQPVICCSLLQKEGTKKSEDMLLPLEDFKLKQACKQTDLLQFFTQPKV